MERNKNGNYKMLHRLVRIHELIASGSFPSTEDLSKELGWGRS